MTNKLLSVVIIDDEEIEITDLKRSLSSYKTILIAGTANNAEEGEILILEVKPDILFLDVEMPDSTGLDLLHHIKSRIDWPIKIIFYTSYEKYLLQALRESAFDYLLKPYQPEEFTTVMERVFKSTKEEKSISSLTDLLARLLPENNAFLIATITGFASFRQEQISYFEYSKEDKHWYIYLQVEKRIQLKRNTKAEDILRLSNAFVQINQQQIININLLTIINNKQCILYPPYENKTDLLISRIYSKIIQEKFNTI